MKPRMCVIIAAISIITLISAGHLQASGSTALDNDMLRELKRMNEQQQVQIDKQAAEIAAL